MILFYFLMLVEYARPVERLANDRVRVDKASLGTFLSRYLATRLGDGVLLLPETSVLVWCRRLIRKGIVRSLNYYTKETPTKA